MKFFAVLALALVSFAQLSAAHAAAPGPVAVEPKPMDVYYGKCGPFELWMHWDVKRADGGGFESQVSRVFAKLSKKEFDLKPLYQFKLEDSAVRGLSCLNRSYKSAPLNEDGDTLLITETCGMFFPGVLSSAFTSERIFYVTSQGGDRLYTKGLCQAPRPQGSTR